MLLLIDRGGTNMNCLECKGGFNPLMVSHRYCSKLCRLRAMSRRHAQNRRIRFRERGLTSKGTPVKPRKPPVRHRVIEGYGGQCVCCGEKDHCFLVLDHVFNDGNAERQKGVDVYRKAIRENFPPRYQLLCHNCNAAKAIYGQCPHSAAMTT